MRVALFTPLSPVRSGISDYVEALLGPLSEQLDLTVVTSGGYRPTHPVFQPDAPRRVPWISYDTYHQHADSFDVVIYQMGDEGAIHGYMFDALACRPGVVVLHDLVLHHAIAHLTLDRGDVPSYVEEMRYSYGPRGEELARQVISGRGDWVMNTYPLIERVLDRSLGVIALSSYVVERVRAVRPRLSVRRIPPHLYYPEGFPAEPDKAGLRRELGLGDRPVVASFGYFSRDKRLPLIIRAFKKLLRHHPDALCLLVGGRRPVYDVERELSAEGSGAIRLIGWQPPDRFCQYMAIADVAVALRYPHVGATPYTPIRLLGLGVPTIIQDIEPLSDLPVDAVVRIPPHDPDEENLLTAAMDYLLTYRDVAAAMAERGRQHIVTHHDLGLVCREYVSFLESVVNRGSAPCDSSF